MGHSAWSMGQGAILLHSENLYLFVRQGDTETVISGILLQPEIAYLFV